MNILEILKERKQILKMSAVALVSAAAVYMVPAHMSSAMKPDGSRSAKISPVALESEDVPQTQRDSEETAPQTETTDESIDTKDQQDKKDNVESNDEKITADVGSQNIDEQLAKLKARLATLGSQNIDEQLAKLKARLATLKGAEDKKTAEGIDTKDQQDKKDNVESNDEKITTTASTKEKEVEIGLKLIESLPTGEKELKDFLMLPIKEEIDRHEETYEKIKAEVDRIVNSISKDKSDNSRHMKIANAIYCWVANNIKYIDKGEQNAFNVFENRCGVCREYARLTNLMMYIAGIPSLSIISLFDKFDKVDHAFNAVYIDGDNPERTGWTLIDTTWAAPKSMYKQSLFEEKQTVSVDGINDSFIDVINNANEEDVWDYAFDIKNALKNIITKYIHDDIATYIEQINEEISYSLREINSKVEYEAIEKFLEIKLEVCSDDKVASEDVFSKLKLVFCVSKDAEKRINGKKICKYFPAFYNPNISFKEANRQILSLECHSVLFLSKQVDSELTYIYPLETELGLVYLLSGDENDAYILLFGNPNRSLLENVKIPKEVLAYGLPIKIGGGIKSLILQGNEEIDISEAKDLEAVNTDNSSRYVCEQGALFERASMDKWQMLYGLQYQEVQKEDGSTSLKVYGCCSEHVKTKIPEVLLKKYKDPVIKICSGIRTLILQDDEKIDIRAAWHLKNIDTTRSSRYIAEDGFLYEIKDGEKGEVVGIFDIRRQIGDIGYIIVSSADDKKVEKIIVDSKDGKVLDLKELPPEITKYNVPVEIRDGIRSIKIKGDEEVELTGVDLEEVDVSESNKYIVEDGVLYEKNSDGKKGAEIVVFNKEIDKGEYKYFIKPMNTILIYGNGATPLEKFVIPQELFDQYKCIEIGSGIKSLVVKGEQRVSCCSKRAKNLKKVDVSESKIYKSQEDVMRTIIRKNALYFTDLSGDIEIVN